MDDLKASLDQYNEQLSIVTEALAAAVDDSAREPLLALQSELKELINLTQESLDTLSGKDSNNKKSSSAVPVQNDEKKELDDEYALFMKEMAQTGAYESCSTADEPGCSKDSSQDNEADSDIEDELASLLGMKCAVYHTHKWGGQPSLHNAMVSSVEPRQEEDQFNDLQVRVLFTHPTHAEMLPCPFFLEGECRFSDEQCRYSHGSVVKLSNLKDAMEPNFDGVRVGSRVLMKLKPPDDEELNLKRKSTEKYFLWHRAVVKHVDVENRTCMVKLEHGMRTGEKRKSGIGSEELHVKFEEIFPLNTVEDSSSDSDSSVSDTEYPAAKSSRSDMEETQYALLIEKSLQNNAPAMGEWEKHTRGIGSKLMLAMGYVPGTGLGAASDGRLAPVEARAVPLGKSLDHCMALAGRAAGQDPLKVEQKLRRLQKREEERNKRAYEREKEKERRNVFNFLNRTIGDRVEGEETAIPKIDIKQSTNKDLNIEQFKVTEDAKRVERDIVKLNSSLARYAPGTPGHRNVNLQIIEKNKELSVLKQKEQEITKEQSHRKNKQKMTVF